MGQSFDDYLESLFSLKLTAEDKEQHLFWLLGLDETTENTRKQLKIFVKTFGGS